MNKVLISVLVILGLTGCESDGESVDDNKVTYYVEGKPLECLRLRNRLSCNWVKYENNKLKGENNG